MFDALKGKKERAEEIKHLLADPKVISDQNEFRRLARELSSLMPIVAKYEEHELISGEIDKLEHILKDKAADPELVHMAKSELAEVKEKKDVLAHELEEMMIEEDPDADKSVIVEIRAGTGGLEASLFAADLFRMYSRYAVLNNWKVDVMNTSDSEAGGFKEIIFAVEGRGVFRRLKYEGGVHRVQRVPTTEASGRIHTSTATVAIMPEAEEVDVDVKLEDLKIDVYRSSGHGGQSVNTTDSAVRMTHIPTGIIVTCQDERSQLKNKMKAMKVLRARILEKRKHEKDSKTASERKSQVGSGDRSEKIRTYNYPDRRITDHRIGFTVHNLENVLQGDLDEMISALTAADRKEALGKLKVK